MASLFASLTGASSTCIALCQQLRESLRNNAQLQRENAAVVQHERERSQALEDEARKLRTSMQEASAGPFEFIVPNCLRMAPPDCA